MSENSTPETSETAAPTNAPQRKKTPLELVKERKAAMNQNRGIQSSKGGSGDKAGALGEAPSSKPMRSSASKQGG